MADGCCNLPNHYAIVRWHFATGCKHTGMKRALLAIIVIALYVLHQDVWFWRAARPLVFGFLPVGLFYHASFTLAVSLLLWAIVKHAWPAHLEDELGHAQVARERPVDKKSEEDQAS